MAKFYVLLISMITAVLIAAIPARAEIRTGDAAPAITLRDVDNRLVFCMKALKQKPVLVSFFFTDCKPCKKEIPELEKLLAKFGNKAQFYLVATDKNGADAVRPYVKKMAITIPVLLDLYQDTVQAYGVTKYPSLYIIGRDGRVKYACFGYDPKNIERIEEVIKNKLY
jgi:cytochrome c biogenesis protein CcmG, thiol:disulfide interchange protein DsbE